MPAVPETYLKAYECAKSNIFLELGGHTGEGMQRALDAGFDKVIGIELSIDYSERIKERFFENIKVEVIQGDVELVLMDILNSINRECTIMIDAHYSGGDLGRGLHDDPIFQVLDIIEQHNIKTHTLMVDDMRAYDKTIIESNILKINNKYKLEYLEGLFPKDVLLAYLI